MPTCLICQQPPTKRDGYDRRGRQRYTCRPCHRDFTQLSGSAFSGYRWPAEVILAAMRWYLRYPLSARHVAELLAERGVDVSARTVLSWAPLRSSQACGLSLPWAARPLIGRPGDRGASRVLRTKIPRMRRF